MVGKMKQHQKLTLALCLIWASTILYGEMFAFWVPSLFSCSWPHHNIKNDVKYTKVAIVTDPQLMDKTSFRLSEKTLALELAQFYTDGASNHMTGVRSNFSELNENIKGRVKFGDGSCVNIRGKGSMLFETSKGEQRFLTDIYFIPELKSNILSLGQATEYGCDVKMKGSHLTLQDPGGRLLVKVTRSPNRLYKINLKVGKPICLHSRNEEESWRQARLGKSSFKTIKKKFLVSRGVVSLLKTCWNRKGAVGTHSGNSKMACTTWGEAIDKIQQENDNEEVQEKRVQPLQRKSKESIEWTKACLEEIDLSDDEQHEVKGDEQCANILAKTLARIKFKKMRSLIGVQDLTRNDLKA